MVGWFFGTQSIKTFFFRIVARIFQESIVIIVALLFIYDVDKFHCVIRNKIIHSMADNCIEFRASTNEPLMESCYQQFSPKISP